MSFGKRFNVAQMMEYVSERVENNVGKGENTGNQLFLFFPQCLEEIFFASLNLPSAHAFSLDYSKILLFGKELKKPFTSLVWTFSLNTTEV